MHRLAFLTKSMVIAAIGIGILAACSSDQEQTTPTCETGQKLCNGECVAIDDPRFGCLPTSCDACQPRNIRQIQPACLNGECVFTACGAEAANCDGDISNGCETHVSDDVNNCGECGKACPSYKSGAPTCAEGKCTDPGCTTEWANCNSNETDGCETQVMVADANNCGECSRSCQGAQCVDGVCGASPAAANEQNPHAVAVRNGFAYFTTGDGKVKRVPTDGSVGVSELASGSVNNRDIAVDDTHVYWIAEGVGGMDGKISRVPITGGAVEELATTQEKPRAIAIDATNVYWTNAADINTGSVAKTTKTPGGGVTTLIANINQPRHLVADDTHVYVSIRAGIKRVLKDGTGVEDVIDGEDGITGIAVDAARLYYTTDIRIRSATKDGKDRKRLVNATAPIALIENGNELYFTTNDSVFKLPKDGACMSPQCPLKLGTGEVSAVTPAIGGIDVDDKFVYWANAFGTSVMKVAR